VERFRENKETEKSTVAEAVSWRIPITRCQPNTVKSQQKKELSELPTLTEWLREGP
jgi:hypothetical protein